MTVQSIGGVVEAAIQRASSATGVDFRFLLHTARRESGYNPNAKARTSSATGLFQFTQQTWLATLKQHGAKYGYGRYADLIQQGAGGRYYVTQADSRAAVMDLRLDPHASALMAGQLAADHAAYLRGRVGREPTAGELYAAHVLGSQGSAKLIDAVSREPGASAAALFPDAAGANRGIFFKDGRPATIAQVYANLTSLGGDAAVTAPAADAAEAGLIQDPSLRGGLERRQEEEALVAMILRGPDGGGDNGAFGVQAAGGMFSTEMLRALSQTQKS